MTPEMTLGSEMTKGAIGYDADRNQQECALGWTMTNSINDIKTTTNMWLLAMDRNGLDAAIVPRRKSTHCQKKLEFNKIVQSCSDSSQIAYCLNSG